jgi:hypothetical protein
MDVHGIRVSPYNLPSAKQYEDLIHSLRVLAATVDNNRGVPQQNIDAVERFEARFFRDAHPVKEKLISFLAKFDGDYCARRPNIYQSGCDAEELVRDVNGEVIHLTSPIHMQELAPLHPLLVTRMLILVHLNLACLFWFLAGFVSSHFGEYQTQVKFTLVGLCLGLRKQVLGMALKKTLLTTLSLLFAPCETVKSIYEDEITLRRGAAREAKCPCRYNFAETYVENGPDLYVCLCTIIIAKLMSVFYTELGTRSWWAALIGCSIVLRMVVRGLMTV